MKAKGRFISLLLVVDTFFVTYAYGFHSRQVLVVDPKLPPVVQKKEIEKKDSASQGPDSSTKVSTGVEKTAVRTAARKLEKRKGSKELSVSDKPAREKLTKKEKQVKVVSTKNKASTAKPTNQAAKKIVKKPPSSAAKAKL